MKTVIVGGVAGGIATATRLRRLTGKGEIIVFERGNYVSFANCGLPYYVGDVIKDEDKLLVQTPDQLRQRYDLDVRLRCEVTKINRKAKTVEVTNLETGEIITESYDKLLLAQGAEPVKPSLPGVDFPGVHTLRSVDDVRVLRADADKEEVKSVLVVGGGFIGVELAENYRLRGKAVMLAEFMDQLLPPLDYEMACIVQQEMRRNGVSLHLGCGLEKIEKDGKRLKATLSNGTGLTADKIILSVGIHAETELATEAGLEIGSTKGLLVDARMRTSDPDIYAVGDMVELKNYVTGKPIRGALAGPASKQARVAADNLAGKSVEYQGSMGTSVLKVFSLTAASTGLNEKNLKALDMKYEKIYCSPASHATYYPDSTRMMLKLLFDSENGKIFGAQGVGPDGVDKRIDVLSTAIHFGATVKDLQELDLAYAPPYSTAKDPVNYLGYVAENVMTGQTKLFHWHDVAELPELPFLVDVRTDMEFFMGNIPDSMNTSLNILRDNLDEFPDDETIYLVCREGLRAYIAECALKENGLTDIKNLSGGYELWSAVNAERKAIEK